MDKIKNIINFWSSLQALSERDKKIGHDFYLFRRYEGELLLLRGAVKLGAGFYRKRMNVIYDKCSKV